MGETGTAIVEVPKTTELEAQGQGLVEHARAMTITSESALATTVNFISEAKTFVKKVRAEFKPGLDAQQEGINKTKAIRDKVIATPLKAIEIANEKAEKFLAEKRRIREEQEAAARKKAQEKAEAERRARIEAEEAENKRKREEYDKEMAKLKALRTKEAAEAKAAYEAEEKQRAKEAADRLTKLAETPIVVPVVEAKRPVGKIKGAAMGQRAKFKVFDPNALLRAVLEGRERAAFVKINEAEIGKIVRATKGEQEIAGVETWLVDKMGVRTK